MNFQGFTPRLIAALGVSATLAFAQAASANSLAVDLGGGENVVAPLSAFSDVDPQVRQAPIGVGALSATGLDSGDGITADFESRFGFAFQTGVGPSAGDPLYTDYLAIGPNNTPTSTISNITGITAGEEVTVVVHAVGDNGGQESNITLTYNSLVLGPLTTEADRATGDPFVTFTFDYDGTDSFSLDFVSAADSSTFQAINGFSISTAIPEPTSAVLLALGCVGVGARRRK